MSEPPAAASPPRILYVVTEDWFFASHFLPMARAARKLGFEVVVATRVADHRQAIEREGLRVAALHIERRRLNSLPSEIRALSQLMHRERPTLVHCIALRSMLAGGLAARRAGVRRIVLAPTGLGHLWSSRGPAAALGRGMVRRVVARLRGPGTVFLFENHDDPLALGIAADRGDRVAFVGGAGVDPDEFPQQPLPPLPPLRLAFVSRMLKPKGAGIAVEAVRRARAAGIDAELRLFGAPDPSNPASIPESELEAWNREPGIQWLGRTDDVPGVWREAHAAILPTSYREGLPRALIEAMASGRPILTTEVPGCRELVRDGVEGLLVPPGDPAAVAAAIARLAWDSEQLQRMGAAARQRFEAHYTTKAVMATVAEIYRELVPEIGGTIG